MDKRSIAKTRVVRNHAGADMVGDSMWYSKRDMAVFAIARLTGARISKVHAWFRHFRL